jgi:hypothetical protein
MPSLNMQGPYPLNELSIDTYVNAITGNYGLGHSDGSLFSVMYVGRSENINKRLKEHISEGYTYFMFSYAPTIVDAYLKECRNYHAYLDEGFVLDNQVHPAKPEGSTLKCPICGQ